MSIWTARTDLLGRRQCKRCHKMFTPRKEGQVYGPKCARKVAGQDTILLDNDDPDNMFARQYRKPQSPEKSAVAAYLKAVIS